MPIQQTKKQSDLEKRLQILRRQVYGKSSKELNKAEVQVVKGSDISSFRYTATSNHSQAIQSDLSYLRQDLLKILIFSSLAIGAQFILFFLLQNHILKINLF